MIKNIKHGVLFLSLVGLLVYFTGCKKTELEPESTNLIVKVKDDLGNDIPGNNVQVYIFDDSTDFRMAWQFDVYGTAINNQLLNGSQVSFTDLDADKNYWILINYQKTVNGVTVNLNNFFTQNTLKNLLEDGTTTTVVIKLSPYQRGNIAFYTTDNINTDDLVIQVYLDDRSTWIGEITNIGTEPTSLDDPNVLPILYETDGPHNYYAVGNNGCVWQGTVNVTSGSTDFAKVNLSGCGFGHINFWIDNTTFGELGDIEVTLNDKDGVGTLGVFRASAPGNCDTDNVLRVTRPTGTYVVSAKPVNGTGCIWVQTLEIKEGCQNTPVEFSACD